MKSCTQCLNFLKFWVLKRRRNKNLCIEHIKMYCSNRCEQQWCNMILENITVFKSITILPNDIKVIISSTNQVQQILCTISEHYHFDENVHKFLVNLYASYAYNKYFHINEELASNQSKFLQFQQQYYTFIDLLRQNIVIYYSLQGRQLVGSVNFYNYCLLGLISNLIFENQQFNLAVAQVLKKNYSQANDKINFTIKKCQGININAIINISKAFMLTQQTLHYYNINKKIKNKYYPYKQVIDLLKELFQNKKPIKILKLMNQIYKQIQKCIKQFYNQYEIKNINIEINEQQIQRIIIYGIIYINAKNISSHIHLGLSFQPYYCNYQPPIQEMKIFYIFEQVCNILQKGNITKNINNSNQLYHKCKQTSLSIGLNMHKYYRDISNNNL